MNLLHIEHLSLCQFNMIQAPETEITSAASRAPDRQQLSTQNSSVHTNNPKTVYIRPFDYLEPSDDAHSVDGLAPYFEIEIHSTLNEEEFRALDDTTLATIFRTTVLPEEWNPRERGIRSGSRASSNLYTSTISGTTWLPLLKL